MEIKEHFTFEVKKGDHTFVLHLPKGASWGNSLDAIFDMLQKVNELSQQSAEQLKPVVVAEEVK